MSDDILQSCPIKADGTPMLSVKTTRNGYFDCVKFFIVFCMLWGHAIQYCSVNYNFFSNIVFKAIYGFHMPLFALISGWFFLLQRKQIYV